MRKRFQLYVRKIPDFSTGIPDAFMRLPEAFDREAFVAAAQLKEIDEPILVGESEMGEELESVQATLVKAKVDCLFVDAGSSLKRVTEPITEVFNSKIRPLLEKVAVGGGFFSTVIGIFLLGTVAALIFAAVTGGESENEPSSSEEIVQENPEFISSESGTLLEGEVEAETTNEETEPEESRTRFNAFVPGTGPFATFIGNIAVAQLTATNEEVVSSVSEWLLRMQSIPCRTGCPPSPPQSDPLLDPRWVGRQLLLERIATCLEEEDLDSTVWAPVMAELHYDPTLVLPSCMFTSVTEASSSDCRSALNEMTCRALTQYFEPSLRLSRNFGIQLRDLIIRCYLEEGMPESESVEENAFIFASQFATYIERHGSFDPEIATWETAASALESISCSDFAPHLNSEVESCAQEWTNEAFELLNGYSFFEQPTENP